MNRFIAAALASIFSIAAFGSTTVPVQLLSPIGSSSGQVIVSTGASTAPAWANVSAVALASQAANTVVANVTASSASPTAFAMPSCSTSTSALQYTSGTGFTCYASSATTTGTLAQFAATTSAQLAGVLSDETGSGAAVFATGAAINPASTGATTPGTGSFTTLAASGAISGTGFNNLFASPPNIGATAPATGKFTTLQATSTITPSSTAGIVGTTTNDSANAGSYGEFQSTSASGVSLTSGTAATVCSLPLTAGDWDVQGVLSVVPAGSTTTSVVYASLNTTTNALGGSDATSQNGSAVPAGIGTRLPTPVWRQSTASPVTVFLVANVTFAVSTLTANCTMRTRRVR